jgi:hypothetical protein
MKLSYSVLCSLHNQLERRLSCGQLSIEGYFDEWNQLVEFAGWTWSDVASYVDAGWTEKLVVTDPFVC